MESNINNQLNRKPVLPVKKNANVKILKTIFFGRATATAKNIAHDKPHVKHAMIITACTALNFSKQINLSINYNAHKSSHTRGSIQKILLKISKV